MKTTLTILMLLGASLAYSDDHPLAAYRVVRTANNVHETILLSKDDPRPERSWELRSASPRKMIIKEGDIVDGMLVVNVDKTNRTFQLQDDGKLINVTALPEGPQTNYWIILQPSMARLMVGDRLKSNWILSSVEEDGSAIFTNMEAESFVVPFEKMKGSNQAVVGTLPRGRVNAPHR